MTAAVVAVGLAAAAAALAGHPQGDPARRLARLEVAAPAGGPRPPAPPGWVGSALGAAAGLALVTGHGAPAAVLAVLAAAVGVPAGRRRRAAAAHRAAVARELPRAADLLATCLEAGAAPGAALAVVAAALGGPVGLRLGAVAAALGSGADLCGLPGARDTRPEPTDRATADAGVDPVARLVRALARATASGAPLAQTAREVAADERERDRWAGLERARRAGVQAVGPLAACFLPAFVLVGVVPVVAGVAGAVLTGFR